MTQRTPYRYILVPEGVGPKSGCQYLKFVRVRFSVSNLPSPPQHGNRIQAKNLLKAVRQEESGNRNSIFRPQELSL
jgi:hypothetical protein